MPPILELEKYSLDWEPRVWEPRVWEPTVWEPTMSGLPILELATHSPVLKKQYRGPLNLNVV